MFDQTTITILLFATMFLFLGVGVPISFALGGVSVIFIYIFWSEAALNIIPLRAYSITTSYEFMAIPLFVLMAAVLQRSGVAADLYATIKILFGRVRGGLAIGTIVICTLFAAMAGISGAATISMGLIAIPAMLAYNYSKSLAVGAVAAGGSLGILIPPSVTMIVYGLVSGTSIGKLYAGGVLPGLMIAALFCLYVLFIGYRYPEQVGSVLGEAEVDGPSRLRALVGILPTVLLITAVMGSILSGTASISESAAVGALGALVIATLRGRLRWRLIHESVEETMLLTCMIFWIVISASALANFYIAMGAARMIELAIADLEVNRWLILITIQIILLLLGMVLDSTGIILITAPIFVPIITALGFDPVWFGILFIINMEIGFLSPPFGYNLFYIRSVAPPEIRMLDIYRSVVPFIAIMLLAIGLCMIFPGVITFLPNLLF